MKIRWLLLIEDTDSKRYEINGDEDFIFKSAISIRWNQLDCPPLSKLKNVYRKRQQRNYTTAQLFDFSLRYFSLIILRLFIVFQLHINPGTSRVVCVGGCGGVFM